MILLRLAFGMAFSADPRARWRQFSVVLGSFVAVLALLVGGGLVAAAQTADAHYRARMGVQVEQAQLRPGQAVLRVRHWYQHLGEAYYFNVLWVDPSVPAKRAPQLIPRGLRAMPEPGEMVISPGMRAAGLTAASFGLKPSSAGAGANGDVGDLGLLDRSEFVAYARPPAGRSLVKDSGVDLMYDIPSREYRATGTAGRPALQH